MCGSTKSKWGSNGWNLYQWDEGGRHLKHKTRVKNYNKIVVSFKYIQLETILWEGVRVCWNVVGRNYHLEYRWWWISWLSWWYMKMSKVKRMCVLVGMLLLWEGWDCQGRFLCHAGCLLPTSSGLTLSSHEGSRKWISFLIEWLSTRKNLITYLLSLATALVASLMLNPQYQLLAPNISSG